MPKRFPLAHHCCNTWATGRIDHGCHGSPKKAVSLLTHIVRIRGQGVKKSVGSRSAYAAIERQVLGLLFSLARNSSFFITSAHILHMFVDVLMCVSKSVQQKANRERAGEMLPCSFMYSLLRALMRMHRLAA